MSKIPTDAFDVIIDDGTIKEPQNDIEEYRYTKKCSDGIDPNGSQIFVLRVTGFLCIIFGLIEIGIGSYLFSEFSNARAGAWWSALLLPIAGVLGMISTTRFRVSFTVIFSVVGALIAVIGAATDGVTSNEVGSLTACGTKSSADSSASFYGASDDYPMATLCMTVGTTKKIFNEGICYCSNKTGDFCGTYALSTVSITYGKNCGYVLSNYSFGLYASTAFCVMSATAAFCLLMISCIALCFPTQRLKFNTLKSNKSSRRNSGTEIAPEIAFGVSSAECDGEAVNYH